MFVTVVAQLTAKTTNSEKTIYFLSLMSCSINKLKSRMLFTCKKCMFSNFTWKKYFCSKKWGRGGGAGAPPAPFLYGPACDNQMLLRVISQCRFPSCTLQKRPFSPLQFGQEDNLSGHSIESRAYWFIFRQDVSYSHD